MLSVFSVLVFAEIPLAPRGREEQPQIVHSACPIFDGTWCGQRLVRVVVMMVVGFHLLNRDQAAMGDFADHVFKL